MITDNIKNELPQSYIEHVKFDEGLTTLDESSMSDSDSSSKCILQMRYTNRSVKRESKIQLCNSRFIDINANNESIFSLTERSDLKGFDVHIENVKVVPLTFTCFSEAPKWVEFLVRKFSKKVI